MCSTDRGGLYAVASGMLSPVKRGIGSCYQFAWRVSRGIRGHSEAASFVTDDGVQCVFQSPTQLFCQLCSVREVGIWHDDQKLFAPPTTNNLHGPSIGHQYLGDLNQNSVADQVSVSVVDQFEMVYIQ